MNAIRKDQLKQIISTRKLAQKVGCSESYLSQVLNGHRSASSTLARLLAYEVNSLLSEPFFTPQDFQPKG
jgi:transcriptional regulator with XRE-family HTH domain